MHVVDCAYETCGCAMSIGMCFGSMGLIIER